jgi:hypothetical protein
LLNTISGVDETLNFEDPDTAMQFIRDHCSSREAGLDGSLGMCIGKQQAGMVAAYNSEACVAALTYPTCVEPESAAILEYDCFTALYSMLPQATANTLYDAADALYWECHNQATKVLCSPCSML